MSIRNGVVSSPISLKEIAELLKEKEEDIGTVCGSSNINKWSIYRPIYFDSPAELTDEDRQSVNWGYTIRIVDQLSEIRPYSWISNRVLLSWYRLTDFENYDHNAAKFLPTLQEQTVNVGNTNNLGRFFTLNLTDAFVATGILEKLKIYIGEVDAAPVYLNECYLGVRMNRKNSDTYYYATHVAPSFNRPSIYTNLRIPYELIPIKAGETWEALLFASATEITQQQHRTGAFLVLDQSSVVEINITDQEAYTISIQIAQDPTNKRRYTGSVIFRLSSSNSYTFTNIVLTLFSRPQPGYAVMAETYNDVTINVNNPTVTINVRIETANILEDPWFRMTANSVNESNKLINSGYQQPLISNETT